MGVRFKNVKIAIRAGNRLSVSRANFLPSVNSKKNISLPLNVFLLTDNM